MYAWHDMVYQVFAEICYDKEYVYAGFLKTFNQLSARIYSDGGVFESGSVTAPGIKSDYNAVFSFALSKRVSFMGSNEFLLSYQIINKFTGEIKRSEDQSFDVSTGEAI